MFPTLLFFSKLFILIMIENRASALETERKREKRERDILTGSYQAAVPIPQSSCSFGCVFRPTQESKPMVSRVASSTQVQFATNFTTRLGPRPSLQELSLRLVTTSRFSAILFLSFP